jgi:hypothetical protein
VMHRLTTAVIALTLVLTAQGRNHNRAGKPETHHSRAAGRLQSRWDPGYTYSNPFGLPRWVRRPTR